MTKNLDPHESQLLFQAVLDNIPGRVFWKDLDCVYLGCNRAFASDAGLDHPDLIIGKTDYELAFSEQAELYRADDFAVMKSGEAKVGYEEPQTTPDGERIWLRTSKIPLRNVGGEIIGVLGTYEDITAHKNAEQEQRRLEARIQHAQKLESLGILAGGIAHDFNNLLVAVLGHADLALSDLPDTSPGQQHVEGIRTAAMRARELTNQMLAYSGKGRFVVRSLDLGEVVREMGNLLEAAIPKKVNIRYVTADDLPAVEVDVAQIRQVVMNLVTNAAEAIEAGDGDGLVTLATGRQTLSEESIRTIFFEDGLRAGEYVFLEVHDDGCGMDKETCDRLFEPFFTTKFQGRGLGLAAVLGIVRGHGGTIKVYSELGSGTSFKVLLPVGSGVAPRDEKEPTGSVSSKALQGTVLVVDDEELVRNVSAQMLMSMGLDVLTAVDGLDALEVFKANQDRIVLVLLDMTMPRMDGEETFRELSAMASDVRVVLTSGYNEQDATNRFVGKGLAGFIRKPFTLHDLKDLLGTTLGQD